MHHRMPQSKTRWLSLNVVIFQPVMRLVLDGKTVTIPEIIDQIHELILEDRRISAKSIAENWASHVSGLRPSFMKIWNLNMRKLSSKWAPKCLKADQERQQCQSSEQHLEFFGAIQMISCRDW